MSNSAFLTEYLNLWTEAGLEIPASYQKRATSLLKASRKNSIATAAPAAIDSLEAVQTWIGDCKRCGLCQERKNIVFGQGSAQARLLFVGEGPGADEDQSGMPFVGKAGQLLNKIIEALGYKREDTYIANVVKCRPPGNRVPTPEEVNQCLPFLKSQIELIRPKVIVALGLTAAKALTGSEMTMGNLRGRFHSLAFDGKTPLMPTYHPAYLLRNPEAKKIVWEDMKLVKQRLEGLFS